MNLRYLLPFSLAGCVLLSCLGCGSDKMPLYPVNGLVTYKGKPVGGAEIAFFGLDDVLLAPDAPFPKAMTDENGEFELTSFELGDGAPAGNYAVTVIWRGDSESDDPEIQSDRPDRLRGRYADPKKTPLQIEVTAGANDLPIELE